MEENTKYRQALIKAMALCSRSERCRSEIVFRLKQWDLSEYEIIEALDYLFKERYLDEERFVRFYVNDKLRFNHWGKIKMAFMLRQKQIPENIIHEVLNQIDQDLYTMTLRNLLASKAKSIKGGQSYEQRGRLALFGQGHGFEAELTYRIAGELIPDN